jgi:hypothetical protein
VVVHQVFIYVKKAYDLIRRGGSFIYSYFVCYPFRTAKAKKMCLNETRKSLG